MEDTLNTTTEDNSSDTMTVSTVLKIDLACQDDDMINTGQFFTQAQIDQKGRKTTSQKNHQSWKRRDLLGRQTLVRLGKCMMLHYLKSHSFAWCRKDCKGGKR